MMKIKIPTATTTERSDRDRLASAAIKAANSKSLSGVECCVDILRYLKSLNLSVKDLSRSKGIHALASLRNHGNPKIRVEAQELFNSWIKTLYSNGSRGSSTCNKPLLPLKPNKPNGAVVKQSSELKTKQQAAAGFKKKTQNPKSFATRPLRTQNQTLQVSQNPKDCPVLMKKNETEMLELFEIAKKSADVANTKGLLLAKEEASICVDTLSLLISFSISSTAPETRRIMQRLEYLTRHKDRKICNSATSLLQHWRQSIIRDQQH